MDFRDIVRQTPAVRRFRDDPIDDRLVSEILDDARFAPSGGNRQGWHVVVVKDATIRRALRELYVPCMEQYLRLATAGMTPFSPLNDRDLEVAALATPTSAPNTFAEHLDEAPVLLVVLADLNTLAAVDRDLPRYSFAGGASVYPFVWSILLSARARGVGGVMTTVGVLVEPQILELMGAPSDFALASIVALGRPVVEVSKLKRGTVSSFSTVDRFDGSALADPD